MDSLTRQIEELPPAARKLVREFVGVLRKQYRLGKPTGRAKSASQKDSKFFGMWKDRPEMADSVAYVRELRRQQWSPDRHHDSENPS
jgi:hypothetical protein